MKNSYYFFLGTTYSKNILPYLAETHSQCEFLPFSHAGELKPQVKWVILTATFDQSAEVLLKAISQNLKVLLLLDWNNLGFSDDITRLLKTGRINLIFAPWRILTSIPQKTIQSVHGQMTKSRIHINQLNTVDHFFCSQPLMEDRPELHFTQFDLMAKLLSEIRSGFLYVKRHPRENSALPPAILNHSKLKIWDSSIEDALATFSKWYGLNSMPLYDAQALGHDVTFMTL